MPNLPILYSFRRCPYAIRARMALYEASLRYILREVDLKNKPQTLLDISAKGTVPVLIHTDGKVYDESLAIIMLILPDREPLNQDTIQQLNHELIPAIRRLKYHSHYDDVDFNFEQQRVVNVFQQLEKSVETKMLGQGALNHTDIAVLPFLRQLYISDKDWFSKVAPKRVRQWLLEFLDSEMHQNIMQKHPPWQPTQSPVICQ